MSRKIIGVTVGTQLPKPNFKQTDPTKGDYIKNKPDFEGLKARVDNKADLVDGKVPLEQLPDDIGGGSSEQVQADFNQNDDTQPDYIKNRPFYAYNDDIMFLDNTSCTSFDMSGGEGLLYGAMFELSSYIETEIVTVVLDGVSYELTRTYNEDLGNNYFGNGSIANVMGLNIEDTGEPFFCMFGEDGGSFACVFYFADTQETDHTISVGANAEIVKTLDIKYLPKNMALGYEEKVTDDIVWDGNTDGLPSASFDMSWEEGDEVINVTYAWYKVSDVTLSKDECIGATIIMSYPEGDEESTTIDDGDMFDIGTNGSFVVSDLMALNIVQDNESIDLTDIMGVEETITFSEAGTYFMMGIINGVPAITVTRFLFPSTLVKIDKKFLPIGVANGIATLDGDGKVPSEQLSIKADGSIDMYSNNAISGNAVYNALGGRSQLSFDDTPISGSENLVTSGGVYTAIENKKITVDSSIQNGSSNAVSGNAVYNALGYRTQLSFDSSPASGSENLVTSGGVYNAINSAQVAVTSNDNGKFMRVVNGVWAAVAVPNAEDGEF